MRFPHFGIELPLIDENGEVRGCMWKYLRRKPKHLPRIGESLYVLAEIHLKVEAVDYSGFYFSWINIRLEPISVSFRNALETQPSAKKDENWKWRAKKDY